MNGISALVKETPESSLTPATMCGHSRKTIHKRTKKLVLTRICWRLDLELESAGALILNVSASGSVRNERPLFISDSVCGAL